MNEETRPVLLPISIQNVQPFESQAQPMVDDILDFRLFVALS